MAKVRDKIDFEVVKEINAIFNRAFNSAYNKIAMLSLADIKDAERINDIIKTEFDRVVIPVSDSVYGGIKTQYEAAIRQAQKTLRGIDSSYRYNFDVVDKNMLDTLDKGNSIYLSQQYDSSFKTDVIESMKKLVTGERTKKEITDDIAKFLGATGKKAVNQVAGMVVTSNTWSRSIATTNMMQDAGVVEYKYLVVLDNVTTTFCRNLAGKTNRVSNAALLRDKYISLDRNDSEKFYDEVQRISPNIYEDPAKGVYYTVNSNTKSRIEYSKENIMNIPGIELPPFHPWCRTEVAIVS